MLSHPALFFVWVGFILSQDSSLAALFHQLDNPGERKHLFPKSSRKIPGFTLCGPTWVHAVGPSCSDHLECPPSLLYRPQTYVPFKSCLSSIAATSSLLFLSYAFFLCWGANHLFFLALSRIDLCPGCTAFTSGRPEPLAGQNFISCLSLPLLHI